MSEVTGSAPTPGETDIHASGVQAAIPASVIAAILSGAGSDAPVMVDARELAITVPAAALVEMIRAARPDLDLSVSLDEAAIDLRLAGLPPVRVVIPAEGLRVQVGLAGLRLRG